MLSCRRMPLLGGRFALLASLLSCLLTISLAGSALVTLSVSSAAAAPLHRSPVARAAASIPKPLTRAAAMTRREDHLLVIRAKSLKRCLRANAANPAACRHAKAALHVRTHAAHEGSGVHGRRQSSCRRVEGRHGRRAELRSRRPGCTAADGHRHRAGLEPSRLVQRLRPHAQRPRSGT